MDIAVNGTVVSAGLAFNPITNWDTWQIVTVSVPGTAGTNTVSATTADPGPNLEAITVVTPN
jgi:hypothetical protein